MRSAASFALAALAIAGASAQLDGLAPGIIAGLSTGCLGGLASLLSNGDLNNCLHLSQAIASFGAAGQNDSLILPLDNYLSTQICPNAACSQSTLSSANDTINMACSSELSTGNSSVSGLSYLFDNYDVFRSALCLEDTTRNDQLCVVQSLSAVESATGTNLSIAALIGLDVSTVSRLVSSLGQNQSALCSDCNKALFTTLSPAVASSGVNSTATSSLDDTFTQQCGGDATGAMPSTIRSSASGNSSTSTSSSSGSGDGAQTSLAASVAAVALGALGVGAALLV